MNHPLSTLTDLLQLCDSGVWGEEDANGGVSVLRSTNFGELGRLDLCNLALREIPEPIRTKKLLQPGDVLLEKSGGGPKQPVGRVALFEGDTRLHTFGNFIARLRANPEHCLPQYLFYFLYWFHSTGRTEAYQKQTTGIRNLEFKRFLMLAVPTPPLNEQRRIVDILSRAEGIIRLQRQAAEKAREIIPALFVDMFGDPTTNPKGWPVTTIGDVIEKADYGTSKKAFSNGSGVAMIRMGNVTYEGNLDLTDIKYVELTAEERQKYSLLDGDILFNRTNSKDLVGKTGVWDGRFEAVAASYFIRVRANYAAVLPIYLWAFFNTAYMKRRLFGVARGAIGQSNINAQELRAFSMPIPPQRPQQVFADRFTEFRGILAQRDVSQRSGDSLFQALLAQAFTA